MKTRLISALVALVLLFLALMLFDTFVFDIAVSAISVIAVYELTYNTGMVKDKFLVGLALMISAIIPPLFLYIGVNHLLWILFVYLVLLILRFLKVYEQVEFTGLAALLVFSLFVPIDLSIFIIFREKSIFTGLFYVLLSLAGAWLSDSGAYFAGTFFGKHKLAPKISPKKTVEGLIGGLASGVLGYLLVGFIMSKTASFIYADVSSFNVNYLNLALIAPFCSAAGVLGDLFASIIKRQTGIKDYGKIMPGHGGVMDRFDSVLFVTPTLYFILNFVNVVEIVLR